mgnify:CR=1 FL=1
MRKISFSNKELHRFLLLGDNNTYIIDKLYPLIRAIKRKKFLSIFCTLRIKKETTTIKLGNFPENSIDEIYAKFNIAKKISENGNNPNYIFNNLNKSKNNEFSKTESEITFEKLLEIFFKKKDISQKYKKDMKNSLSKNLKNNFFESIRKIDVSFFDKETKRIIEKNKIGTAKNFLNYTNTLCNFALIDKYINDHEILSKIINNINKIKKKNFKQVKPNKNYSSLITKIKKLSPKDIVSCTKFIEELLKKNNGKTK